MKKIKAEIIEYINTLKGYEGYVQFSHRKIEKDRDIFVGRDPQVEDEEGFVYEAHFSNGDTSIVIKQINSNWQVSETDLTMTNTQTYLTDIKDCPNILMAEIWTEKEDALCEGMKAQGLQKVVFAGFVGDRK